jgi:ribosomal protein S12 methylthiotransferase accessory factor
MHMEIVFPDGDRVDALSNGNVIRTEQDGSGPAPFELFLASIGTCAGIYVSRFCRQRGISTADIRILQKMRVNPATRMVDGIDLDIVLPDDFPEQYKDAVVRSAQLCAVKKHLEAPPEIQVRTVSLAQS